MNSATELWQRYQDWLYYHEELNFYVDISRIRFTADFVAQMQPKFEKAFADMQALEAGAIANPDEDRMVGHYWLRAPELAPNESLKHDITSTLSKVDTFAKKVIKGEIHPPHAAKFTDILSIGIGGSALGPEFVAQAMAVTNPLLNISFIDNTDPDGIDLVLGQLSARLATTLVVVISKSGGTPEAANGMKEAKYAYEQKGLEFNRYAVAITGEGSKLDRIAKEEGWIDTFAMYDWIGGRTSELSAVGLLPAALQGIDIMAMLEGAKVMDEATRIANLKQNPAALLALAWYSETNGKGEKDMVILPYKDRLLLFSRYLQQLVMESLGKEKDLDGNTVYQGIAVYGNKGSTDQHAYVQQLREGVNNFFATFIEVLSDRAPGNKGPELEPGIFAGDFLSGFWQGTRKALYENGRGSITVSIPEVSPRMIGALIALYERAVGLYGFLVNVNAYHQPGVEAGKKAAAVILDLQKKVMAVLDAETAGSASLSIADLAHKVGQPEAIETVYLIVRHLDANSRINLEGNTGNPSSLRVSSLL
ncbi:glucose-6-phosphate isomerase [Thalassoporum mexicanum PCC 7367]|uniref:glucose-6-phosphate isomerase n=1 Tax=Thalassoporum mexicanum TaxID=3457544 RepID=UPI00029FC9FB|nr:glucose-6-phosphate isomerase [Pseudanabaena sp. PCC 7367]AFY69266.1 glucose-6-phosphate isomerase [Pseudanabaena sp. PCC 7367]